MKLKNKGKVYPSPSSSSSASSREDHLSVLNLLPAAILVVASVLSLEDRQVLAYMITRSLKTTTTTTTNPSLISPKKRSSKKHPPPSAAKPSHKPPDFDCDCFDCYTTYWLRWDSSPNRELIHQVIEAFEDHLSSGESHKASKKNARLKRRDANTKTVSRIPENPVSDLPGHQAPVSTEEAPVFADDVIFTEKNVEEESAVAVEMTEEYPVAEDSDVEIGTRPPPTSNDKGLARKVLPDILGLFNSRLWGLWNPNV
ncbi:hypothetical protein ES319_A03G127900v1 [Gossypium barbadense]|uniref:Uncharacterized protein n=2 Tax=Gossypium TaxID=3633 RepID=A0A5J5WE86_GOSBA|nr:hypothetical protein ES319_A03G127900v1 [Gossypium barbadense]TYI36435.1 hypothetical protein ES332_A03G140900v1 [Gossypium tomentosum]